MATEPLSAGGPTAPPATGRVWLVAGLRGLIGGVVTAGAVFFTGLAGDASPEKAGISAGAAFFAYLVVRFAAEGVIDSAAVA